MTAKTPAEEIAQQMQESAALFQRMEEQHVPYRGEIREVLAHLNGMSEGISRIVEQWKTEYLAHAKAHDKSNPPGQDYEDYSTSIIGPTDMIRQFGFSELSHRLYALVIRLTDQHCQPPGPDLHRGALYADYGITHLEQGHFELGISWLLAAANEDFRFNRIPAVPGGYAWEIYGQWVDSAVFKKLHPDALSFVAHRLGITIGLAELMEMLKALAGNGDLNLLRGVVEYESVRGRADYMGHSVRFSCLRDLATLFEVLLKRIGERHNDPKVQSAFSGSPMLAHIVHFMHYSKKPKPSLWQKIKTWLFPPPPAYSEGLFWNSVRKDTGVLEGIKNGFNYVKNFGSHSINDVRTYLQTHTLLHATRADEEAVAKRMLLSYRLRNQTSHSFKPEDPGIIAHADEFQLWLLQSIFYAYFWFTRTGQVTL